MNDLLLSALQLREEKLSIIPLRGKTPRRSWEAYQNRLPLESEIVNWFETDPLADGVGVISGRVSEGLVILDFDCDDWREAYDDFLFSWPTLRETRQVISGSGRRHVWLRTKTPIDFRKIVCDTPQYKVNVEFRGNGHQTAAPPSTHPLTGQQYRFLNDAAPIVEIDDIDPVIEWFVERWERHPLPRRTRVFLDEGAQIGSQNDEALAAACQLRDAGYQFDQIIEMIWTSLQKSAQDPSQPWTHRNAEIFVEQAFSRDRRQAISDGEVEVGSHLAESEDLTELGMAKLLARLNTGNLLFCSEWGTWLQWCGTHWMVDPLGAAYDATMETIKERLKLTEDVEDPEMKEKIVKTILSYKTERKFRSVARLAQDDPAIRVGPSTFDSNPWLFCLTNTVIDLRTMEHLHHNPEDFITKCVPIDFDPDAQCPTWLSMLDQIFRTNLDIIPFLQKAFGYSLAGDTREQCFFFLYGDGRNGKSTVTNTLRALLGDDVMSRKVNFATFMDTSSESARAVLALLPGIRAAITTEAPERASIDTALLKDITGGQKISVRRLYHNPFEYRPQFKLWMEANYQPEFFDRSQAIFSRLRPIPFLESFRGKEDRELETKLTKELPGILNWALTGVTRWLKEGLGGSSSVVAAQEEYELMMDPIARFIDEACTRETFEITSGELFASFREWCRRNDIDIRYSKQWFGRRVSQIPGVERLYRGGTSYYVGVKPKPLYRVAV